MSTPTILLFTLLGWTSGAHASTVSGNGFTLDDATLPDRSIVQRPLGQRCPAHAVGWAVEPLFQADAGGYLPPGLARYCVFDKTSTDAEDLATYGAVGPDRVVVAGLAAPTAEEIAWSFEDQAQPFPAYAGVPPAKARLTLIDSSPTADAGAVDAYAVAGVYDHGQQLATLALRSVCDSDGAGLVTPLCVVDIATQLALGYTGLPGALDRSPDGGVFGSQADLASALQRAVLAWQEDAASGPLVLNVSLGWHPDAGGAESSPTPAVAAVKDALTYASCKDALVLAAVGNVDTPWHETNAAGPLYPAAWEVLDAPSASDCSTLFRDWWTRDDEERLARAAPYEPLVYGVSGLDVSGRTLGVQRPLATTPHAAAGSHLAAYNPSVADYLTPISGTSASTVVVASAAAVVRSHAPGLSAHEVMEVLRDGANVVSGPADSCNPGVRGCLPTHEITVCDSLAELCDSARGEYCDTSYTASECALLPTAAPLVPGAAAEPDQLDIIGLYDFACDGGRVIADATGLLYACPYEELYGASALPMTLPQPPGGECPWCPAFLDGRVDLLMKETDLSKLDNVTVSVDRAGVTKHYPLGQVGGYKLSVFLPVGAVDATVTKMLLSYTYDGENVAYVEPLYLTW